jgi:hypothetical protein
MGGRPDRRRMGDPAFIFEYFPGFQDVVLFFPRDYPVFRFSPWPNTGFAH